MRIVSNSTVLIVLSRTKHLWLLEKLFGSLIIPTAVHNDVVVKGSGKPGAKNVAEAGWIHVEHVRNASFVEELSSVLHRGEAEAIALAKEIGADLIILDDNLARSAAKNTGLKVAGTLGVLLHARTKGLINELKPLLDNLRSAGFHMGDEYYEVLEEVGEI